MLDFIKNLHICSVQVIPYQVWLWYSSRHIFDRIIAHILSSHKFSFLALLECNKSLHIPLVRATCSKFFNSSDWQNIFTRVVAHIGINSVLSTFYAPRSNDRKHILFVLIVCLSTLTLAIIFYAPGLKGPPGASSNRIVRLSVRPFVCPSVCLSVIPSRLQTKCNIESLGDDIVTKLGL